MLTISVNKHCFRVKVLAPSTPPLSSHGFRDQFQKPEVTHLQHPYMRTSTRFFVHRERRNGSIIRIKQQQQQQQQRQQQQQQQQQQRGQQQ